MKFKRYISGIMSTIMLIGTIGTVNSYANENKLIAFPGAEGGGMYALGARAADSIEVYHVTNLNDSGEGSFRDAVSGSNRIIIFDVSGTIMLDSILRVKDVSNLTILGQTSPGDGICIGGESVLWENCSNIIVRYMRFRPGDLGESQEDAFGVKRCTDFIVDHCSASWSVDETLSAYANRNFTAQYCIISESLNKSVHDKGDHGYGGIWGGENASFHHNLISTHKSRMPRIGTSSTVSSYNNDPDTDSCVDIRNNVFYNWGNKTGYGGENGVRVNFVNNYYRSGAATTKNNLYVGSRTTLYANGNVLEGGTSFSEDNYKTFYAGGTQLEDISGGIEVDGVLKRNDEFIHDYPVTTVSAQDALDDVLQNAGASYMRDKTDERIINDVINKTAPSGSKGSNGLIDSQEDVGGWCYLYGTAPVDTDSDGIPDEWENANGLDPNRSDSTIIAENGYTNIENYANDIIKSGVHTDSRDTSAIRQAIFKGERLDRTIYYDEDVRRVDKAVADAKNVLENSTEQAEINNAAQVLSELLENTEPRYKVLLENLISEIDRLDEKMYSPVLWKKTIESLENAKTDLNKEEDNLLLKSDYERLLEDYDNMKSVVNLQELYALMETAEEMLDTEYIYTKNALSSLSETTENVWAEINAGIYTPEKLSDLIRTMTLAVYSIEEIDYDTLKKYVDDTENAVYDRSMLDENALKVLDDLKAEGEKLLLQSFESNDQITAYGDKVKAAIKEYGNISVPKNNIYMQDFEGEITETIELGKYTVAEESGNKYLAVGKELAMYTDVSQNAENIYYSTDFKFGNRESAVQGFIFDDKYSVVITARLSGDKAQISVNYTNLETYTGSGNTAFNLCANAEDWNNITSNFNSKTKEFSVYFNNYKAFVYNFDDMKGITKFGIFDPAYKNPNEVSLKSYASIDNLSIFSIGEVEDIKYGDVNCDGEIAADDAAYLLQKTLISTYTMPIEDKTDNWLLYSDVSADGEIAADDAAFVLQKTLISTYIMPAEISE